MSDALLSFIPRLSNAAADYYELTVNSSKTEKVFPWKTIWGHFSAGKEKL